MLPLLLLSLVGVEREALAFSAQGHRWRVDVSTPVSYELEPSGSEDVTDGSDLAAIRRAFATWAGVSCSYLRFQEVAFVAPAMITNDGRNRIFWVETAANWPGDAATLALTYTFYTLDANRRITDSDIVLNGANWRFTTVDGEVGQGTPARVDVETVIFHEIGHFFGLDHSTDTRAAMYPSNNKLLQRTPADDDVRGICSLYGNGTAIPGTSNEPGTVGAACETNDDCSSDLCVSDSLVGRTYCSARCLVGQGSACPAAYPCTTTADYGGLCLAPAPVDELCDQCTTEAHCSGGVCAKVPGVNLERSFCSRPCDPTPGIPSTCPEGYQCRAGAVGSTVISTCVPSSGVCDPKGKGGLNEICYANETCKAGFACLGWPGAQASFCYPLCPVASVGASCPYERSLCLGIANQNNAAACFTVASAGQPCIPELCADGALCAFDADQGIDSAICYRTCNVSEEECQANEQCIVDSGLGQRVCEPRDGFKLLGQSCTDSSECKSRLCSTYRNARLCTTPCATTDASSCDTGLKCIPETGSTQGLCWPESFTDPSATESSRGVSAREGGSADYCGCDFTSGCDSNCDCDPECGSSCSCSVARREASQGLGVVGGLLAMGLAMGLLMRPLASPRLSPRGQRGRVARASTHRRSSSSPL